MRAVTEQRLRELFELAQHEIGRRFAEPLQLADVADAVECPTRTLQRAYWLAGTSFRAEVAAARLQHARELLGQRHNPPLVGEAAARAAYSSKAQFTRAFTRVYGVTPSQYRRAMRDAVSCAT